MQSRKFTSLEEAQEYLKSRGKLKYWGREGIDAKTYVYTLTIGSRVFHLFLHEDGLVRVTDETYEAPSQ